MVFHVTASPHAGGDLVPNRREDVGGTLNDVSLASNTGPTHHTILALGCGRLVSAHAQNGLAVCRISAGQVFLQVISAIAIGVSSGLRKQVVDAAEILQPPRIRDTIVKGRCGTI